MLAYIPAPWIRHGHIKLPEGNPFKKPLARCPGQAFPAVRRKTVGATPAAARKLPGVVVRGRGLPGDGPAIGRDWDLGRMAGKGRQKCMDFTYDMISPEKWSKSWISTGEQGFKAYKWLEHGNWSLLRWRFKGQNGAFVGQTVWLWDFFEKISPGTSFHQDIMGIFTSKNEGNSP